MQQGNGDGKKWLLVIGGVLVGWWLLCSVFTAGWWAMGAAVADGPRAGWVQNGPMNGGMPVHGPVVYHTLGFSPLLLLPSVPLVVWATTVPESPVAPTVRSFASGNSFGTVVLASTGPATPRTAEIANHDANWAVLRPSRIIATPLQTRIKLSRYISITTTG